MSRLIIQNLPGYITPEKLKEHFQNKAGPGGIITDVKLLSKPDGTSRRFGFVGFKTDREAAAARDWFDRTFIDSTRINVNVVYKGTTDAPTPGQANEVPPTFLNPTAKSRKYDRPTNEPIYMEEKENEVMSDFDWMRRRTKQGVDSAVLENSFERSGDDKQENNTPAQAQPESEPPEDSEPDPTPETILQTSRLFLRNLAFSCTDSDLLELCRPFGEISHVYIPLDPHLKQSKGVAYVTFAQPHCALKAYETLDRKSFQGRLLHVLGAVDRKRKFQMNEEAKKTMMTVKEKREGGRKAVAGNEFNWSMLYMNSDAVASSIANRMNIPKADILNPDNAVNPAVKLALAETHIIQETKIYLESQGVSLTSFSSPHSRTRRSDTVILVKNIPYGTTAEQIREMFEVYGELRRVLVPPAGTMAVVEFVHADEASKAFKAIVYRRMGSSVVYLERGPVGMFVLEEEGKDGQDEMGTKTVNGVKPITISEQDRMVEGDDDDEPPGLSAGSTLFLKNLAFSTTTERLMQVFRNLPSFSFARVQTKPDPQRPDGPRLSMGYGFVGFKTVDGAQKAIKSMQGFALDGHALHVKFAGRGTEEEAHDRSSAVKSRTTKMIVKNVPFEATREDIRELFSAHGHLKSVRLPKKFDSRSRGFAFLEFVTRHEAENVFAALRHTHLLGRHLVLEWAEEAEQDLDVLRQKVVVGFGRGAEHPGKKRKLEMGVDSRDTNG